MINPGRYVIYGLRKFNSKAFDHALRFVPHALVEAIDGGTSTGGGCTWQLWKVLYPLKYNFPNRSTPGTARIMAAYREKYTPGIITIGNLSFEITLTWDP
jgi:hypothetical protein